MIHCVVGIMALAMTLFALPAQAAFIARTTHGNFQVVKNGQGGVSLLPPQGPMGNANAIASTGTITQGMGATAAGSTAAAGINLTGTAKVPVNGTNVPVQVKTNVGTDVLIPAAIAAATCAKGGAVGAIVCAGGVVVAPIALQWLSDAGARIGPNGQLQRVDPNLCSVEPCYTYRINTGFVDTGWGRATPICQAFVAGQNTTQDYYTYSFIGVTVDNCLYKIVVRETGAVQAAQAAYPFTKGSAPPDPDPYIPASMDDIAPYMKNKPVDPGIVKEVTDAGQDLGNPPLQVNGPAQIVGPAQTTVNNITNVTTTTTTTNNYTYNNNTITNTSSVTNTVTKAPDGTVTDSTTTTNPVDPNAVDPSQGTGQEGQEEAAPVDTALPPVPSLYERKYPNGMEGIWNDYKEQLKGTDLVSLVGKLMPNVGDGGSCPTWPINLDLEQWASYGTHDVAPSCWIWDVAKAILILSALLLARSLVFGG